MDLLRLVLSRQKIDKLRLLPRLLRSREFLRQLEPGTEDDAHAIERRILKGELSAKSRDHILHSFICSRACFLRDAEMYLLHRKDFIPESMNFWEELATDVPGIQGFALALLEMFPFNTRFLATHGVLFPRVNWTSRLKRILLTVIRRVKNFIYTETSTDFFIGFLGGSISESRSQVWYVKGAIVATTEMKTVATPNDRLDRLLAGLPPSDQRADAIGAKFLIESGYIAPLNQQAISEVMFDHAATYAREEILCLLPEGPANIGIKLEDLVVTVDYVERARKILENESLRPRLPFILKRFYMIVTGYLDLPFPMSSYPLIIGKEIQPGTILPPTDPSADWKHVPGRVCYSPLVTNKYTGFASFLRESYRREGLPDTNLKSLSTWEGELSISNYKNSLPELLATATIYAEELRK